MLPQLPTHYTARIFVLSDGPDVYVCGVTPEPRDERSLASQSEKPWKRFEGTCSARSLAARSRE